MDQDSRVHSADAVVCTGWELGSIYHHPSTRDLLAPHTELMVQHVGYMARSLERMSEDYQDPESPRSPHFEAGVSNFRTRESMYLR